MEIRPARFEDVPPICEIYNHYICHTTITFEETPLEVEQMGHRVATCARQYPWLVCIDDDGLLVGYAYATKWKERAAYRHTAESTIYLREGQAAKGYGQALYSALLAALDSMGCHVVLGCIAIPNDASIALHEKMGFRKVAHFNEVGRKHGRWLDVGYWQRACQGG